jgi:hypothetical protein
VPTAAQSIGQNSDPSTSRTDRGRLALRMAKNDSQHERAGQAKPDRGGWAGRWLSGSFSAVFEDGAGRHA